MKKVILDTNFILTCVKQKIDFLDDLFFWGYKILIPKQVFTELDQIMHSKQKYHSRNDASLALTILEKTEGSFDDIDLKDSNVDRGLVKFAEQNKDVVVGTLDRKLKHKIKNPKIVINEKKKLSVI